MGKKLMDTVGLIVAMMFLAGLVGAVLGGFGLLGKDVGSGVNGILQGAGGCAVLAGVISTIGVVNDLWKEYKKNQLGNVRFLIKSLRNQNPEVRIDAAKALGNMQAIEAVEPLITALEDPDVKVRMTVAEVLGKLQDGRAVEPLITALQDPKSSIKFHAAEALGKLHDSRAVEPLISALQDPEDVVRFTTALALGELHDSRAVEPLIIAASDKDQIVRNWAIRALGEIGSQLEDGTMRTRIAAWLQAFAHTEDNDGTRQDAITAAEKIGVPDNIPDDVWFTVAVDLLVGIYRQHPQGFVAGEGGKQENEIRRIGNSMNKRGGMELMLATHKEFARKCGVLGAPRNLEFLWDRIGQWRG